MSVSAKLIRDYNTKLMSSDTVRMLVRSVAQDPQNETVNYAKSKFTVTKQVADMNQSSVQQARRAIIGWLNAVYFSNLDQPFNVRWWWEMHTRIQKLLVVSMVLEGDNLRSFGPDVTPMWNDIPQALVELYLLIDEKRKDVFPLLARQYAELLTVVKDQTTDGAWYAGLYLQD